MTNTVMGMETAMATATDTTERRPLTPSPEGQKGRFRQESSPFVLAVA
jgi:hypothetical protein